METNTNVEKKSKPKAKASATAPIRVRVETRKKILQEVAKANKKDFGRRIRAEDILALSLSLLEARHIQELQDASLSNADRFERDYRAYIAKHGHISKDAYLGKRLNGETASENAPKFSSDHASKNA